MRLIRMPSIIRTRFVGRVNVIRDVNALGETSLLLLHCLPTAQNNSYETAILQYDWRRALHSLAIPYG